MAPHWPLQTHQRFIDRYKDKYDAGWDVMRTERYNRIKEMGLVDGDMFPMEPNIDASSSNPDRFGPDEVYKAEPWSGLNQAQKDFQSDKFAIHAALIEHMDSSIGLVLDKVKEIGEFENTVIFFNSDNGASSEMNTRSPHDKNLPMGVYGTFLCIGPAWSTASNTPFRRHKKHVYEGGIATPLIVHWPQGIPQPGIRREPGHVIDYMPTLIDLAGGNALTTHNGKSIPLPIPGKSLAPTFKEDVSLNRELLFFEHLGGEAIRMGDWKAVHGKNASWQLYDMKNDRTETNNLASSNPDKLKQLTDRYNAYKQEINLWN
jgi:arylsulfatase